MNTELLLRVKAHILEEPKRLRMYEWYKEIGPEDLAECPNNYPACGTVACIAGWTCVLAGNYRKGKFEAINLLNITYRQAEELFYVFNWPDPFYNRYVNNQDFTERAKITAEVIDDFIRRHS